VQKIITIGILNGFPITRKNEKLFFHLSFEKIIPVIAHYSSNDSAPIPSHFNPFLQKETILLRNARQPLLIIDFQTIKSTEKLTNALLPVQMEW
jgi:hypothetical protein